MSFRGPLVLGTVLAVLALPAAAAADVDSVTVNSTADPGDANCATNGCTLREAISQLDDGDTDQDRINIRFNGVFSNTITLASALPTIDEPLSIASSGVASPEVSGNNAVRPFTIDAPAGTDVSISGISITKGGASAGLGGGVSNMGADLTISGSTITANKVTGHHSGGGIYSYSNATLSIENSTISDNSTGDASGGGIEAAGALTIKRSTISGNETNGFGGGGGVSAIGSLTVEGSTISGNHIDGGMLHGGGVAIVGQPATIRNSTISGNYTTGGGGDGGGIWSLSTTPEPEISNTIVANNTAAGTGPNLESKDDVFQLSFTLVEDTSSAPFTETVAGSNIFGFDPQLGPLGPNGGPTWTHLPAATSRVVDQGSTNEAADQRALPRPMDQPQVANSGAAGADGADIGAVELQAPPASPGAGRAPGGAPVAGGGATPTAKPLAFGRRTLVTLKLAKRGIPRRGPVPVVVTNRNGFSVSGRLSGRTTKKVSISAQRKRRLKLKTRSISVGAHARKTVKLRLSRQLRRLLGRKHKLSLRLTATVRDPAGHSRSVRKTVKPRLKRKRKRRNR